MAPIFLLPEHYTLLENTVFNLINAPGISQFAYFHVIFKKKYDFYLEKKFGAFIRAGVFIRTTMLKPKKNIVHNVAEDIFKQPFCFQA